MGIKIIAVLGFILALVIPSFGLAASTTTEVFCTNNTNETIIMKLYREDDTDNTTQVTSISPDGAIDTLYDYPPLWYDAEDHLYIYHAYLYDQNKSEICHVKFSLINTYDHVLPIQWWELSEISGICVANTSLGAPYELKVFIETN